MEEKFAEDRMAGEVDGVKNNQNEFDAKIQKSVPIYADERFIPGGHVNG